ncbi:MAG TPA: RES domain-containing protein [Gemmatimonadales bacterium]|nr:RES domain-containing protein [Gemmatimonadales bacterium]
MASGLRAGKQSRKRIAYDGTGAALEGARWNSPGRILIYASEHYATAVLERLAHAGRTRLPGPHHAAAIHIPDDLAIERFEPGAHPGWAAESSAVARDFGDAWHAARRTAVLLVPSVPGQPVEWNFVIDPSHPDAARIAVSRPFDVTWDGSLFGPPTRS